MSGKNLFSIRLDHLVAPKRVLRDQADYLSEMSDGTILGYVETARGSQGMDECFTHSFHIHAPTLDYRAKLFEVTHSIDVYPAEVRNDDWTFERECPDVETFEAAVSEILNAAATKRRLESLRCLAFAEMDDPPTIAARHSEVPTAPSTDSRSAIEAEQDAEQDAQLEVGGEPDWDATATSEVEIDSDEGLDDMSASNGNTFEEWGEPIPFQKENVQSCPDCHGAAIIYNKDDAPLFIAYSKNIRSSLQRQLGRKASPEISKLKKSGLKFVCGLVTSIDQAEEFVQSRINTMPFRALLGDSDSSDWS